MKKYDVIIIESRSGRHFSAYELLKNNENLKIAILRKDMHWKKENVRSTARKSRAAFTARAVRS